MVTKSNRAGEPRPPARKRLWTGLSVGAVVLLALGVVGAFLLGRGRADQSPQASPQASPKAGGHGWFPHGVVPEPGPPDRDREAVIAALRALDACALLDLDYAKSHRNPNAVTIPTGPHSCSLVADANWSPGYSRLSLAVGADNDFEGRFSEKPIALGGAKAYEIDQGDDSLPDCVLDLPVSYTLSIELKTDASAGCQLVEDYGAATVAKLADPDARGVDTAKRPLSAWDGCAFLTSLYGPDLDGYRLTPNSRSSDPFSGCESSNERGKTGPSLKVTYDKWAPKRTDQLIRIAGKDAAVRGGAGTCTVSWHQGGSSSPNEWFGSVIFELADADCVTAERHAAEAVELAERAPEGSASRPQRPLLYGPDDNDTGRIGACADLFNSPCAPYQGGVTVAPTFEAAAADSQADQAVQCEAFSEAVKSAYGSSFSPVIWGTHCMFVEPTHDMLVYVDIDGKNVPADYGTDPSLWADRQVKPIDGKQSVTFWDTRRSEYDVYYSPYGDISRPGNLHIHLAADHPRGVRGTSTATLEPARAELAERVITLVDRKYFR
ncbi:hypothetical protein Atai01_09810 [Amycolatopsis taiwanensis]|uniref:Uncharacterized protein n=1 Tax=Amycolatopsis taiwanensis TaxID=342230 RepID=A0A9W6QYJ4_9PSEU|nr:hypothetical protein Atai01_09810 [Amycolatopsis taiwanensis]